MEIEKTKQKVKIIDVGEPMKFFKQLKGKNTTNKWLIDHYKLYLLKNSYARNTWITYSKVANSLLNHAYNNNTSDYASEKYPKITSTQIENFLMGKTNIYFSATKVFLKYLYFEFNRKFLNIDYPRIKQPDNKLVVTIPKDDIKNIIINIPEQYRFLTKFINKCGLRISEPWRLRVTSINWESTDNYKLLKVIKAKGRKERLVPINPIFVKEIKQYIEKTQGEFIQDSNRFIFDFGNKEFYKKTMRSFKKKGTGTGFGFDDKQKEQFKDSLIWHKIIIKNSTNFENLFRNACKSAKLSRLYYPHHLRSSRATELLDNGMDIIKVRDFLGHNSVKTTEKYLSTNIKNLTSDMERLGL